MELLEQALVDGDAERLRALGHDIAGTGSTFGFEELTRLGHALNEAARAEDLETCAAIARAYREFLDAQPA